MFVKIAGTGSFLPERVVDNLRLPGWWILPMNGFRPGPGYGPVI